MDEIDISKLLMINEIAKRFPDLKSLLEESLSLALKITASESGSILIVDRETNELTFDAYEGHIPITKNIKSGEGIAGWVAKAGSHVMLCNIKEDSEWANRIRQEYRSTAKSLLSVPIKGRKDIIGVIELFNKRDGYTGENLKLMNFYVDQLSCNIEHAIEMRAMEERLRRLSTFMDASYLINSTLDLSELLDIIMEKTKEVMDAEASSVFQIDEDKKELYFLSATGEKGEEAKKIRVPFGKGIVGWVAENGETLFVPDVSKDRRHYKQVDDETKFKTKSILAVPLKTKDKLIGVGEVLNKRGGRSFTKEDVELFEALGEQAAIAMDNARLYKDLEDLFTSSISSLVSAIEAKDQYTKGHTAMVTKYSLMIADEMKLEPKQRKTLERSALLHDVGKIGMPDRILNKPGKLTEEEFEEVKRHPEKGAAITKPIKRLREITVGIKHHHERYDGSGYPDGLKAEAIPLISRIISVADAFDAMYSDRPYRSKLPVDECIRELEEGKGKQFDSKFTDAFITTYKNSPQYSS